MSPLGAFIDRHPALAGLRDALAEDIGVRISTRAAIFALDLLSITLATAYLRLCRGAFHHAELDSLVELLWRTVAVLGGAVRAESKAEIFTWRDRGLCAEAAFYARIDASGMFHLAARSYFHIPEMLHDAVASALIMPTSRLGGCRWQTAPHPIGLVRKTARIHNHIEHVRGGRIQKTDALYCGRIGKEERSTMPLDVVVDTPGDAIMVRRYSTRALEELRQAAAGDVDLNEYMRTRVIVGGKPQDTWRLLGWTDARGQRVDRRFRRLCAVIRGRDDLVDLDYLPATPCTSAANHTVYREVLFGGRFGSEKYVVYQHVPHLTR